MTAVAPSAYPGLFYPGQIYPSQITLVIEEQIVLPDLDLGARDCFSHTSWCDGPDGHRQITKCSVCRELSRRHR